jgi:hypothetical protein
MTDRLIFDTTLRDGEQPGRLDDQGRSCASRCNRALRVDIIEAGFAASSMATSRPALDRQRGEGIDRCSLAVPMIATLHAPPKHCVLQHPYFHRHLALHMEKAADDTGAGSRFGASSPQRQLSPGWLPFG